LLLSPITNKLSIIAIQSAELGCTGHHQHRGNCQFHFFSFAVTLFRFLSRLRDLSGREWPSASPPLLSCRSSAPPSTLCIKMHRARLPLRFQINSSRLLSAPGTYSKQTAAPLQSALLTNAQECCPAGHAFLFSFLYPRRLQQAEAYLIKPEPDRLQINRRLKPKTGLGSDSNAQPPWQCLAPRSALVVDSGRVHPRRERLPKTSWFPGTVS